MPSTSTGPDLRSGAAWLASAPEDVQRDFLQSLDDGLVLALPHLFEFWALPHQLPPGGDWRTWVILGGRGAGKTRAGAEWVRSLVEGAMPLDPGRCARVAIVGETLDQAREVMVFGDSGILACAPPDRKPVWHGGRRMLTWPNGATAQVFSAHEPEALRGPQFDAAWVDEFGCAAIDKGTNQPNKFLDPKSSESAMPHFSNGMRDEFIQMQYLRASYAHWLDPANNPVSDSYGGPMVDMSRAFVWAWDARPYPFFPGNRELWADGDNYARGHWISGRMAGRSLASVVEEICARAGLHPVDSSGLYGYVRGYTVSDIDTARGALQPLMLAYGVDALERDGTLVFRMRDGAPVTRLDETRLVESGEIDGRLEITRAAEAELAGRVRLRFVETDASYEAAAEEAVLPDEATHGVSTSDMALALTRREGRQVLERWLAESRVARDTLRLALPPSRQALGAGDVLEVDAGRFRIDRVEQGPYQIIEAVRMEPGVYAPAELDETVTRLPPFVSPAPVEAEFMDLPLMRGDEAPHSPHLAAAAIPWPGSVAVYSSATGADFTLNTVVGAQAVMGTLQTPLQRGPVGRLHWAGEVEIRLISGELQSVSAAALLAGGNLAAIGNGTPEGWELFQFQQAEIVGDGVYRLRRLLRGQFGSDAVMAPIWPVGARFVLLDGAPMQLSLPAVSRGTARHYRVGPASRPLDDPSYTPYELAFEGVGLRPYAPAHLRTWRGLDGALGVSWMRRTRTGGDSWDGIDVPLGEEREQYLVRVTRGGAILREVVIAEPGWSYDPALELADTGGGAFELAVAQISAEVGPGYFARCTVSAP